MAVSFIGTIKRWKGLSTDDKPTSDIPTGSVFEEADTGKCFVYLKNSWIEDYSRPLSVSKAVDIGNTQQNLLEQILLEIIAHNRAYDIEP